MFSRFLLRLIIFYSSNLHINKTVLIQYFLRFNLIGQLVKQHHKPLIIIISKKLNAEFGEILNSKAIKYRWLVAIQPEQLAL